MVKMGYEDKGYYDAQFYEYPWHLPPLGIKVWFFARDVPGVDRFVCNGVRSGRIIGYNTSISLSDTNKALSEAKQNKYRETVLEIPRAYIRESVTAQILMYFELHESRTCVSVDFENLFFEEEKIKQQQEKENKGETG
jgi:hypothetical protein